MNREVKTITTITEVTVPVVIKTGIHRRIHPCYGFLGIESENVEVEKLIYFKDMDPEIKEGFVEEFGYDECLLSDDDIIVVYARHSSSVVDKYGYMELEFFVSHSSNCY